MPIQPVPIPERGDSRARRAAGDAIRLQFLGGTTGPQTDKVRDLAETLRLALSAPEIAAGLSLIPAVGGTSHQVDALIQPCAGDLGFWSQRRDLFHQYPVSLRPDWYHPEFGGVLLEVERGKTVTNNMDVLDLWKCHICREAAHLFLLVPLIVTRTRGVEAVFDRVVTRLSTFFEPGNLTNVASASVFGYP